MKLINKLQECTTIGEAEPILKKLHAGPAVKKLVETAILLSNSPDPQQKEHAYSFMKSAIQEIDDMGKFSGEDKLNNKKMTEEEEEEDDFDIEHKLVKEEVLDNHNNGPREDGSEQSSDNTEPYPGEGKDTTTGEKPMQDMDGTVNQWNETGMPGGAGMGQPPMGQPPMGNMPGLAPDVAQEMGMIMPEIPPFNTSQMMRQMQYTLDSYHRKNVAPLNRIIRQQREAIKILSKEIKETRNASGSMKLDVDSLRKNASATFRETESPLNGPMYQGQPMSGLQPQTTRKKDHLDKARSEISEMDKIIRSQNSTIYG